MKSINNLKRPLSEFDLPIVFIEQARRIGIHTLQDMMDITLNQLQQHKEYDAVWYGEMLSLLKEYNLLRQYQDKNL
jgi:hypothetical protein